MQMFPGDRTPLGVVEENFCCQVPTALSDGQFQLLCAARRQIFQLEDYRE
jgi:hypothetical protein